MSILIYAAGVAALLISQPTTAEKYRPTAQFIAIPFLEDGHWGVATDVSDDGSVVVGQSDSELGPRAYRWQNGEMINLGILPNTDSSAAAAISGNGKVIVGRSTANTTPTAFRWMQGNGMESLGLNPGSQSANNLAMAVSEDGEVIVGQFENSNPAGWEAFAWTPNTGIQGLGVIAGGIHNSVALAVTADGSSIVGRTASGLAIGWIGAEWFLNGLQRPRPLLTFPGAGSIAWAEAQGISPDGEFIVGYGTFGSYRHAAVWSSAQHPVSIGYLPPLVPTYGWAEARAASSGAQVVVGKSLMYYEPSQGYRFRAFVWSPCKGMRDLKEVIRSDYEVGGLNGWHFEYVGAISPDGKNIVGWGYDPTGYQRGFLIRLSRSLSCN